MAGLGEHITALVRSHGSGDDPAFYSVALQVAAREARQGHHKLANDIKQAVETSRKAPSSTKVSRLAQPRGDMAELVSASYPEVGLPDLVAPPNLHEQVQRVLAEQRQRKTLFDHGFTPTNRLLLEGPPGTGKTMTASVLARELSLPLFTIRLDSLMSKFMGETASKLRTVFETAQETPGIYLFDEFDALGADRAGSDVGEARRVLNSFLVFLENALPESLVIAATNHRAILDRALFRRFDLMLSYELPDSEQSLTVMRHRLGSLGKQVAWSEISNEVAGLSHAELVAAAEVAAKAALLRGEKQIATADLVTALGHRQAVRHA